MKSFDLVEPATLEEAVALLDPEDAGVRAIAGGTALMLMMKARLFQPTRLVSLRRLDGAMRGVREGRRGGLRIGALTTLVGARAFAAGGCDVAGDERARCGHCPTSASGTWRRSAATLRTAIRTWICRRS